MESSDEFPAREGGEQNQRLVQDLRRMYHTGVEDAQSLARLRTRLEESSTNRLSNDVTRGQQQDSLRTQRETLGHRNGNRPNFFEGRMWRRRTSSIAAVLFVTVLVGALIVVLTYAHQNRQDAGNTLKRFGPLSSLHMLDPENGWVVTSKGYILRSTYGGVRWQDVTPQYPSTLDRQSIITNFLTPSIAWVAVSQTDTTTIWVFRTGDGGQTWQKTAIQAQTHIVSQITFFNSQDGWLLSKQANSTSAEAVEIFRTADGGKTWAMVSSALAASTDAPPSGRLPFGGSKSGLSFLNTLTGWVTGSSSLNGSDFLFLYRTKDGGTTWYPQKLPLSPQERSTRLSITPPMFFSANDGILPVTFDTGNGSHVDFYVTHDGGDTWNGTIPIAAVAAASDFVDVNHGWASDDGMLLSMTNDGGQHWILLSPSGSFTHISHLDFVSPQIGWAIGSTASNSSSLLQTVDGGRTWKVLS